MDNITTQNGKEKITSVREDCSRFCDSEHSITGKTPLTAVQLTKGAFQICAPLLDSTKQHLTELVGKQNKIKEDLSVEKLRFTNKQIQELRDLVNTFRIYHEKLFALKRKMQNIYQRTQLLRKRSENLEASMNKNIP